MRKLMAVLACVAFVLSGMTLSFASSHKTNPLKNSHSGQKAKTTKGKKSTKKPKKQNPPQDGNQTVQDINTRP